MEVPSSTQDHQCTISDQLCLAQLGRAIPQERSVWDPLVPAESSLQCQLNAQKLGARRMQMMGSFSDS